MAAAAGEGLLNSKQDDGVNWDMVERWSKATFLETMETAQKCYSYPEFELCKLERLPLVNEMTRKYHNYRSHISLDVSNGVSNGVNEVFLFHGSPLEDNLDSIGNNGFDLSRLGKTSGNLGWYGAGIYGTQNVGAAIRYSYWNTTRPDKEINTRRILVCRAVLGKTFVIPDNSCDFIGKPCQDNYHSHQGKDRWDPDYQYVVFNPHAIQPLLFLHFRPINKSQFYNC